MKAAEVAKAVMRVTKTSQAEVAQRMGLTGQSNVSMYLQSKSMRVEALLTILNGCGYQLVARDPSGKYPTFTIGEGSDETVAEVPACNPMEDMVRRLVQEELRKMVPTPSSEK